MALAAGATAIEFDVHMTADGVPVGGYFVWTLTDNFEWSYGFTKKFGLVHVDFATQRRTWKDSAHWYQKLIHEGKID